MNCLFRIAYESTVLPVRRGRSLTTFAQAEVASARVRDVLVDVLALGEPGDLVHEPVGEVPALGVVVVRQRVVGVLGRVHLHRRAEADDHGLEGPHEVGVHRLHVHRADDTDRNHRHAALTRKPRYPRPALVHVGVQSAGALRVQAQDLSLTQNVVACGIEGPLGRAPPGTPDRDLPGGPEEPRRLPRVEVLGLGQERHLAPDHQWDEEGVAEGLMVGRQHGRAVLGDVLPALHLDAPEDEEDRGQDRLEHPVHHAPKVPPSGGPRSRYLLC